MVELRHSITEENVSFVLEVNGVEVSVDEWSNCSVNGCDLLLGLLQTDQNDAAINGNRVTVSHSKIAELHDGMLADLKLPGTDCIAMHISHNGLINQPNFQFKYDWIRDGRARPIIAKRKGCFLHVADKYIKLPHELYKIASGIDSINSCMPDDIQNKLSAWSQIESYLPSETTKSVTVDGFLNSTRVFAAHAFELAIKQTSRGINFYPVLLNRRKIIGDEINYTDNSYDKLLVSEDQNRFADLFEQGVACSQNYSLGAGKYIILGEQLHKALSVVRQMQDESDTRRLEFLQNPKAVFSDKGISEEMLGCIFSDRIEGFGERRLKIIPWIKIEGQEWIPSENSQRGLFLGDKEINLTAEDRTVLCSRLTEALKSGEETITFKGETLPVVESFAALAEIHPIKPEKHKNPADNTNSPNFNDTSKYVLYVKDNFTDIKYCPKFKPREGLSSFDLPPKLLKNALKPHQLEGVKWLVENYRAGVGGVLLADDMGLGKTFQALAFLAWLREQMQLNIIAKHPILIVAPTGLLKNWEKEHDIHLHCPGLGDLLHAYGTKLKCLREDSDENALINPLKTQMLKEADWILTTYETLNNYQTSFAAVHYSAVIFDEMQKIKTPNTRVTEAAQTIKADLLIGMTGTPIENRLADLWCLVDTLQPARLGTLAQFSEKYEKSFSEDASRQLKDDLSLPGDSLPPLMLRRMKSTSLKGLPKITPHYIEELMPSRQAEKYKQTLLNASDSDKSGCRLDVLHNLRNISLHPDQYTANSNDNSFIAESARLRATFRTLDAIHKLQEKALIFIEFRDWHQSSFFPSIIKRRYNLENLPLVISGAVSGQDRQRYVDAFQEESGKFDVMLLSPRAGGVGLTLTNANHVIHLSRWWNPAVEDQCTDRAYRIGQKKDVHVYYPMAIHPEYLEKSFDFKLKNLLDNKRLLSQTLLIPPVSANDKDVLADGVIFNPLNSQVTTKNLPQTCEEIGLMEPLQFEDWVADQCKHDKLIIQKTSGSWDGGADLIIKNRQGHIVGIIQCKHTQSKTAGFNAIDDLLRAREMYCALDAKLIAVTNAVEFNSSAIAYSNRDPQLVLICQKDILRINEVVTLSLKIL